MSRHRGRRRAWPPGRCQRRPRGRAACRPPPSTCGCRGPEPARRTRPGRRRGAGGAGPGPVRPVLAQGRAQCRRPHLRAAHLRALQTWTVRTWTVQTWSSDDGPGGGGPWPYEWKDTSTIEPLKRPSEAVGSLVSHTTQYWWAAVAGTDTVVAVPAGAAASETTTG